MLCLKAYTRLGRKRGTTRGTCGVSVTAGREQTVRGVTLVLVRLNVQSRIFVKTVRIVFDVTAPQLGSDAVSKQMSDKLQFVAQSDKLKHVGHETASLPAIEDSS